MNIRFRRNSPPATDDPVGISYARRLRAFMLATPAAGIAAVAIYAFSGDFGNGATNWSVLAVGLAVLGAAEVAGLLLGFLFGLPKTVDRSTRARARLATNTNLDQISDWLTKILVGLGLVQLGKVSHGVRDMASSIAPGLGDGAGAKTFAGALLIYAVPDGFLVGYIWTRISLSKLFRRAAEDLDPIEAATDEALLAPLPAPPEEQA